MPPMRYHDAMMMALVEQWDADTCIFHLPTGEMTVKLEDIHYILRISIQGETIHLEEDHTL